MKEPQVDEMMEIIKRQFQGRDPIAENHNRMQLMTKEELIKLVLIACNKVGTAIKGSDYESEIDTTLYFSLGVDLVFNAYDTASGMSDDNIMGNA